MAFNAQSAMTYNNACNYPGGTIKIILEGVRAPVAWQWSVEGVTAVMKYQQSKGLDADGMVGLKTLNKIIADLENCGKVDDAALIKQFIAQVQANQAAKQQETAKIISSFSPGKIIYPFRFEKEISPHPTTNQMVPTWAARGTFEVLVKFNPALSADERMRYEYRQYIKGTAGVQEGSWDSNYSRWTAASPPQITNIGERFAVPSDPNVPGKGLTPHYKEDGKEAEGMGNTGFRFGYRNGDVINGKRFKNVWSPHSISGSQLIVRDTPGYSSPYVVGSDPKVIMNFTFRGVVVEIEETQNSNGDYVTKIVREIQEKTWSFSFFEVLRWDRAVPAVQN